MLAGVNLLAAEGFVLDLAKKITTIGSCKGLTIEIAATPRVNERIQRSILSADNTTIPAYTRAPMRIHYHGTLPQDRDILFEPTYANFFAHVVDAQMSYVYASNTSGTPIIIPAKIRLGNLVECAINDYFLTSSADADLAVLREPETTVINARFRLKDILALHTGIKKKLKLNSSVTVYNQDLEAGKRVAKVANAYPGLWVNHNNVAKIPKAE